MDASDYLLSLNNPPPALKNSLIHGRLFSDRRYFSALGLPMIEGVMEIDKNTSNNKTLLGAN